MPKLSRSILKRIEERPFAEKQNVAREAYHQWRLSEQNKGPRPPRANPGVRLLAAELKQKRGGESFPKMCQRLPDGDDKDPYDDDPYQIKDGDKTYEFWWNGDRLQIRTTDDSKIGKGRKRKPVSYIDRITRDSFRTGYFGKRGGAPQIVMGITR